MRIDLKNVTSVKLGGVEVNTIKDMSGVVLYRKREEKKDYFYIENISNNVCDVTLTKTGSAPAVQLQKSLDGVSWETVDTTQSTIATIPSNTKMYFKGINDGFASSSLNYNTIKGSQQHNVGGNIMSLLYGSDFEDKKTLTSDYCLSRIFVGNTYLINANDLLLPATTLTNSCYYFMFNGCTSLVTTPTLPATTLASSCYQSMFEGCTSLVTAPELPATTLSGNCYYSMFYNCSSLTTTPTLPATTLVDNCYRGMFYGCTSLTTTPTLPATTLASGCYQSMFYGCTKLQTSPILPATTLVDNCYRGMFYGCTSLSLVTALFTTTPSTTYTANWLGISGSSYSIGTFVYNPNATWVNSFSRGTSTVPSGWRMDEYNPGMKDYLYFENTSNQTGSLTINEGSSASTSDDYKVTLQYSFDGENWKGVYHNSNSTKITDVPAGSKVYFKGVNGHFGGYSSDNYYKNLRFNKQFNVGGNIMSVLYGYNFEDKKVLQDERTLQSIFRENTTLVNTNDLRLPATTLQSHCYRFMFYGCTSLKTSPLILPAMEAKYLCYQTMFRGCSSLTTVPILPATTLENTCYSFMFYGCSSLTQAPELPATNLSGNCYYSMFYGCTSLVTAPELPATTLASGCYYGMFQYCSKLNYVKHNVTNWNTSYASNWLNGVSSTGTMECPADSTIPTSTSGIPSGWTKKPIGGKTWVAKEWGENVPTFGNDVWTDGTFTYYSDSSSQYRLLDGTWKTKSWGDTYPSKGRYVWKDSSNNIYYSINSVQYQLVSGTWSSKSWGSLYPLNGNDVWTDNNFHTYYSNYDKNAQYQLVSGTWNTKSWGTNTPLYGDYIWKGSSIYYSGGSKQYQLQGDGTFWGKSWGSLYPGSGDYVWNDGDKIYYSNGSQQYELKNGTWVVKDWGSIVPEYGKNIWHDNSGNTYYSDGTKQYQLI